MSSKSNKYTLLDKNDKNQYDESDMIEMVDWEIVKNQHKDQSHNQTTDYVVLDDENEKIQKSNKPVPQKPQKVQQVNSTQNAQNTQNVPKQSAPRTQASSQVYPTYSTNPNPTQINMNGTSFRMQNAPEPKKAPKVPEMKVACNFCTFQQNVPGNTQVYVCCCCNNMNQCFPLYGLFICGYCQGKVCYPYGTSDMIRCTRCGTVNKVPTQPQRRYTTDFPKQKTEVIKKQEQKKSQKRLIDFQEQQIVIDKNNEPLRPNNERQVKQQQIFFEDIPSLSEVQQKQLNYPDIKK